MKTYVQFYDHPHSFPKPVQALGSFGVIRLDGRLGRENAHRVAKRECGIRGYSGYRIVRGDRLSDAKPISNYIPVNPPREWDEPIEEPTFTERLLKQDRNNPRKVSI